MTAAACLIALGAEAQDREKIGYGRHINNDFLGGQFDRWRTGSVTSSRVYGRAPWDGNLPERAGDLIELRFRGEIIAPASLQNPAPEDRPHAGILSFGVHTHFDLGGNDVSMGGNLAITGPQTGLIDLHEFLHKAFTVPGPTDATRDGQIGNGAHPTALVELGREITLPGDVASIRPFVEAQAGIETYLRAGMDMHFGGVGRTDLMLRDAVTGHRYRATTGEGDGFSFVLGGDVAQVRSSALLPESRGYELTDRRTRLRAGVHLQGEQGSGFYGLTWLGEEFENQPQGQMVGSIRLNLEF